MTQYLFKINAIVVFMISIIVLNPDAIYGQSFVNQLEDSNERQRIVDRINERGTVNVWVMYEMDYKPEFELGNANVSEQRSKINNLHERLLNDLNKNSRVIGAVKKMPISPMAALFVDIDMLDYLYSLPYISKIEKVKRGSLHLSESTSVIQANQAWNLGFNGDDNVIVIIDTGVDYTHEALSGRVVDGACFSTHDFFNDIEDLCTHGTSGIEAGKPCSDISECDHGTHVAGIVAGNSETEKGVAPGADIISIQVFSKYNNQSDCGDEGPPCLGYEESNLQQALEHIIASNFHHNYNISSINMSLGDITYSSECNSSNYANAIGNLTGVGISVVAASGNDSLATKIANPACISDVISVGATNNQDDHAEFSNAASFLDLVAPGVGITSSVPNGYESYDGTSMAAPHVAGTIALMRNATPTLSQPQIRQILRNTAHWESSMNPTWPHDQPSNQYGYGRLDTFEAIISALSLNPNVLLPDHNIIYEDETFEGKDIYILKDHTLHIQGEVTLDKNQTLNERPSSLNIAGILEGPSSASLNLIDESQFNILASGLNYFEGDINIIVKDELTFAEDTTLENGFNLAIESGGILNLVDGVTFSTKPGVKFTMETNTQIASIATSSTQNIIYQSASSTENPPPNEFVISSYYEDIGTPSEFGLENNYPNPFNPTTVISYKLPVAGHVTLEVFDMLGRRVALLVDEAVSAGRHEVQFDASNLSSGMYIYRIRANQFVQTRQMVLVK